MRNQHPGTCYRCGKHCAAGEGHFERMPQGHWPKWRLQHAACAIKFRGQGDAITELRNEQQRAMMQARREQKAAGTGRAAQKARAKLRAAQ